MDRREFFYQFWFHEHVSKLNYVITLKCKQYTCLLYKKYI